MSSTDFESEIGQTSPDFELDAAPTWGAPAKARTGLFVWFGSTMAFGLALAGWYVSARIVSADQHTGPSAVSVVSTRPAPPKSQSVSVPVVVPVVSTVLPENLAPKKPQLFLEIAGLGPKQDAKYVKKLELKGYHARIEVDPSGENPRILIGPFDEQTTLLRAQLKLETTGVLALAKSF